MKKERILTVRVDRKIADSITSLSRKEDRPIAWISRKLLEEALRARGLLKTKSKR